MEIQGKMMKKSIRRVSLLLSFNKVRAVVLALLGIDFVQRVYFKYPVTGLYIVLLYTALPYILTMVLTPYIKEDLEEQLQVMQKQYKYSKRELAAHGICYIFIMLLLLLWQMGLQKTTIGQPQLEKGPFLILAVGLIVLIGLYIYYKKKLLEALKNNKL